MSDYDLFAGKEKHAALPAAGVLKAVLPGLRILVGTFRPLGFSELIVLGMQSGWAFPCCHYLLPTIGTTVGVSIVKSVWGLNLQREEYKKSLEATGERRQKQVIIKVAFTA